MQDSNAKQSSGETTAENCSSGIPWIKRGDEFIRNAPPRPPPFIDGVLNEGEIGVISGPPNTLKTQICTEFARAVVLGDHAFGKFRARKGQVLFIEDESPAYAFAERLRSAGLEGREGFHIGHEPDFRFEDAKSVEALGAELAKLKIDLCIVDTLPSFHDADENSKKEIGPILKRMKRLRKMSPRTAFLYVQHDHKGTWGDQKRAPKPSMADVRGSGAFTGKIDIVFSVRPEREKSGPSKVAIRLTQTKNRDGPILRPLTLIRDFTKVGTDAWCVEGEGGSDMDEDGEDLRQRVLNAFTAKDASGNLVTYRSIPEIATAVGRRKKDVRVVLDALLKDGLVLRDRKGRLTVYRINEEKVPPSGPGANDNAVP
jgi:hypothetical protein